MKILITGGFGFIGGSIAQYLSNAGHEILLGSRYARNIPDYCPRAISVITNWTNQKSLLNICQGVNCIIHAAGMNVQDCSNDSVQAIVANGLNTAMLVEAAKEAAVQKFIYLSTAHVYSSSLSGKITEDTCLTNHHPYATSHRIGEDSVLEASRAGRLCGVVFRLSNAFGIPSQLGTDAWLLLVNDICRQAVMNEKIILRSGGRQYRDFVSLSTVVKTIANVVQLNEADRFEGVFNLGSGNSFSVLEMTKLVVSRYNLLFGKDLIIEKGNNELQSLEKLSFSVDKIIGTGFYISSDPVEAIDALLLFCNRIFLNDGKK